MVDMNEAYEEYGKAMDDSLRKMSALQSLVLGKKLADDEVKTITEFECIKNFLESPDNSKEESDLKKLFVEAIIAGIETGTLPIDMPADATPESIVSIVDEGLTQIKVAYKLENGQYEDVYEAEEVIIDHRAARNVAFMELAVKKAIELADLAIDKAERESCALADKVLEHCDDIINVVEAAYPEAIPVAEFCRLVLNNMKPEIKEQIHKGIAKVSEMAKSILHSSIEKMPEIARRVKDWLLS